ncbi:SubName: Full=Uncharacterized protein {ECO:0000313/EMBL:CCA66648.1} [Serendipita indica DSM 11827]|uniref:Uncharacterized protein n=1 Tax=Serendipita indica (strain DSM 11827) TaxID=1109443 RepID=G4T5N5_SERID|nr:SubName: Full=Uncharacterized protein {ECO:0000313/EMBL:CCA66648.1} [Serendipita indica DSM 11827]CCA66648.1 hypothetical protein PIIN_00331 [Serendipita indica DSM 11827]
MATSLVPPGFSASSPQSPVAETSPATSLANVSSSQILLERSDIDKSLKALEGLVSLLYDYTQLWQGLVSLDKKLVKAFRDAGGLKRNGSPESVEWPSTVFITSSLIFDSVQDVDSKFSKLVEREYETCTQELKKWIKKLKKEDKALDEYTAAANAKIKAAGQAYEKKARKGVASSPSGPSLDSYSALLSTVSASVNSAKHQHALFTSSRHVTALYTMSGSVGRIADAQWMKTCDLLRRCAGNIGALGESRSYVEAGWRGGAVVELPLSLPIQETSPAGHPVIPPATSPIEAPQSPYATTRTQSSEPLTSATGETGLPTNTRQDSAKAPLSKPVTNSHDVLETIAKELRSSADDTTRHPQDGAQKPDTIVEPTKPKMPEPKPAGANKDGTKPPLGTETKAASDDKHDTVKATKSSGTTRTTATTDTTKTDTTHSSNGTSAKDTVSGDSDFKEPNLQTTSPTARDPTSSSHPAGESLASNAPKPDLVQTSIRPISPTKTRGELGAYFPAAGKPTPQSPVEIASPTPIFAAHSTTQQGTPPMPQAHPNLPHAPTSYAGRAMGRTRSIDSTASSGSLVAAMRDRYNAASPPPTMPPSARRETFSGRDREGGKVSDMASRFTPIEGPLEYDSRYPRPGFPISPPPLGRGLTDNSSRNGDNLPLRTPLTRNSVDEFGSSFAAATPGRKPTDMMDRRQYPSMPSHMGAGPSYDVRMSELELQERELELKRRELQLAREREALKARERGHDFHEDSEREGSGYGDWRRRRDEDERYRPGDTGYESASSRDIRPGLYGRTSSRREDERYGYDAGTPRMNAANSSGAYREQGFTMGSRNPGSNVPYHDLSTGLGVMGLGLPPGAGPSGMHSRESLPLAAEPASYLGPPKSSAPSTASRSRDPSPRRSAEVPNTQLPSTARQNEKEKGGTWLGKGLKRFSMPLGAGSNS